LRPAACFGEAKRPHGFVWGRGPRSEIGVTKWAWGIVRGRGSAGYGAIFSVVVCFCTGGEGVVLVVEEE